jgi:hypothetical protein
MTSATNMYALTLEQTVNLIVTTGHLTTHLAQGRMGNAKSAMLKMVGARLPKHKLVYFDATTKSLGDLALPSFAAAETDGYVKMVTHEELGLHLDGPVAVMIDEYGKAQGEVKNALTLFMNERKMGGRELHPDSIIFATTNLGGEGLGDTMKAHHRNRITVIKMKGVSAVEYIEWGVNNGIDPAMLGWVRDNPHCCDSFEDVPNPEDNQLIFHPKAIARTAFWTPRSGEKFSHILKQRHLLDDVTVTAAGIGTVGERAALEIMAYVTMTDQLPTRQSIMDDPANAKIPTSAAAMCMVIYRTLGSVERDWIDAWMIYMQRLSAEAQGMFANGVRSKTYNPKRQSMVMTNAAFTKWAQTNHHMFSADV